LVFGEAKGQERRGGVYDPPIRAVFPKGKTFSSPSFLGFTLSECYLPSPTLTHEGREFIGFILPNMNKSQICPYGYLRGIGGISVRFAISSALERYCWDRRGWYHFGTTLDL